MESREMHQATITFIFALHPNLMYPNYSICHTVIIIVCLQDCLFHLPLETVPSLRTESFFFFYSSWDFQHQYSTWYIVQSTIVKRMKTRYVNTTDINSNHIVWMSLSTRFFFNILWEAKYCKTHFFFLRRGSNL